MSISTHVLDISIGRPAAAVSVRLERENGSIWTEVSRGVTNGDGRVPALVAKDSTLQAGTYRLAFDIAAYFERRAVESFYREITIEFIVRDAAADYHLPLLVSPFGYSTYRGS